MVSIKPRHRVFVAVAALLVLCTRHTPAQVLVAAHTSESERTVGAVRTVGTLARSARACVSVHGRTRTWIRTRTRTRTRARTAGGTGTPT